MARNAPDFDSSVSHVSGRRLFAHWIDGIVIVALAVVPALALSAVTDVNALDWPVTVFMLLIYVPYFALTQAKNGQSPGKRVCGIRVVDRHRQVPGRRALMRRSAPLLFEWLGMIAFLGMMSSGYRQRWGDRWAHTYVIEAYEPPR
jgi:uncharacterized RDD family membrane protein YckC